MTKFLSEEEKKQIGDLASNEYLVKCLQKLMEEICDKYFEETDTELSNESLGEKTKAYFTAKDLMKKFFGNINSLKKVGKIKEEVNPAL